MHDNHTPHGRFSRLAEQCVFGARPLILLAFAAITLAMLYFASQLKVDAGFKKQVPLQHEYMRTFLEYEGEFGAANRVLVAVMAKDGRMFTPDFFSTLEGVTADVMAMEATDDARVRSLYTPNVRFVEVVEDGFAGGNVVPDTFDGTTATAEQFQVIRDNILKAGILGRLVARDWSGAMVWADLVAEDSGPGLDYQAVAGQLEAIRSKYEKAGVTVHIIGFAKVVGDIADGARSVIKFFAVTVGLTWLLLFLYSTSVKLASLTVACALVATVWMLGALRLFGFGMDPMNMLTPFLIFAIAVSHGEQMINRFRGELFFGGLEDGTTDELRCRRGVPAEQAARRAFRALLVPGAVALAAGCIGFAAILVIPIRIIHELAITATVGVAIIVLTDLVLLPVLLSHTRLGNLERKREYRLRQLTRFDRVWALLARLSRPLPAAVVIVLGVAIWFAAEKRGDEVKIGDSEPGVAELRPQARYNQDARLIADRFALSIDILNVIAEARPNACTLSFKAMDLIDRFAWHMGTVDGVEQVIALPMAAKIVNAGWHDSSVRWRVLPRDPDSLRVATQGFETDSGLLNADCSAMPVSIFLSDHRAETIDRVIAAVRGFRERNGAAAGSDVNLREKLAADARAAEARGQAFSSDEVNLRLGTGHIGVAAAVNDTVRAVEHRILYLLYAAVFLMCLVSFRSARSALCIVLPLVLVTELGHALMVQLGIGMKINTLTVVALGVGIGVDYAIYLFARMAEAMRGGKTVGEAYFVALKTTGVAIFYTALTLALGVALWIFSDLKFQADMGVMLTFMFVVNMVAAIVFLPALCRWLLRPLERDDRGEPAQPAR
ncbi:RND family transporter [Lysobacter sp. TAF61]|uniref:efflux RND transporter permease subunit n=1 Tax=Lysobacter sp. TAF61 TaxID=3233072 RepID=UPI003F9473AF